MLHKDYDRGFQLKKISGSETQGAWSQDELIDGRQPVVIKAGSAEETQLL
jgi:hypothetical protein